MDELLPGAYGSRTRNMLPDPYPEERVWFTSAQLPGVQVMYARNSPRSWSAWHDRYVICLVHAVRAATDPRRQATAYFRYRRQDHTVRAVALMLLEPGELHVTHDLGGHRGDFDVFEFDSSLVEAAAAELGLATPVHLHVAATRDPQLCAATQRFASSMYAGAEPLVLEHQLQCLLRKLLYRHAETHVTAATRALDKLQISRGLDYIVAHHADNFSLDDLADACGAAKSTICHDLPRALGVTPMALRTVVRVSRARSMLAQGASASEAAAAVGFYDQPQFTRSFARAWGITPGRFARMVQGGLRVTG